MTVADVRFAPELDNVLSVVEDLDDTKVHSRGSVDNPGPKIAHHIAVARSFGHNLTMEEIDTYWGQGLAVELPNFYGNPDGLNFDDLLDAYNSLTAEFPKTPLPGAHEFDQGCNEAGLARGIVTTLHTDNAVADLVAAGFNTEDYLFIHGADVTPATKPNPTAFAPGLEVLRARGIAPREAVYIGDALGDGEAAVQAGMQFVGVATGRISVKAFMEAGFHAEPNLENIGRLILSQPELLSTPA